MTEQELLEENERLRSELAAVTKSRDNLREMVCTLMPIDKTEITAEEFDNIIRNAKPIDDLLRGLLPPEMHHVIDED